MFLVNPVFLVLASVGLGLVIGVVVTLTIVMAREAARRNAAATRPELPEVATTLLDQVDLFSVILDSSLTPVYANPIARRERTVTDAQLRDLEFLRRARQVMNDGTPDTIEPDPLTQSSSVRIHLVRIERRFVAVLAEDLGEEQRVNAMRRDFIANVSHELKTPIAAIGLLSEAVREAADSPKLVRGFAKSLVKESRRLGELSRDIIQLSEAQSTLRPEDREPLVLADLVRKEIDAHQEYAEQHGVKIAFTDATPTNRDTLILGRPSSLSAAIANILSNAIQHSPRGGRVGVGVGASKDDLEITVADQGEGIAQEHLPRIFERFYRVDGARARATGGTGLGLSIARHTMRAHGGEVSVWSQVGVGTTFTLRLPLRREAGKRAKPKKLGKARRLVRGARSEENPEPTRRRS